MLVIFCKTTQPFSYSNIYTQNRSIMKKIVCAAILVAITLFGFVGCADNEDEVPVYKKNSLNGKWHLASYGGGFGGQFTNYKRGLVTWTFDTINNTVAIRSKRDYFGPLSGTYPYGIQRTEQSDIVLHLNDSVRGIFGINDDELIMSNGLLAIFKR